VREIRTPEERDNVIDWFRKFSIEKEDIPHVAPCLEESDYGLQCRYQSVHGTPATGWHNIVWKEIAH
jgi:hypothetical protein